MKFLNLFSLFFISVLLFSSCSKDEDLNGLDETDPCYLVTCLHGDCINGDCLCDEGWTGPDCGQVKEPTSIKVNSITILNIQSVGPNGDAWDFGLGKAVFPDFYINLRINNQVLYSTSIVADYVHSSLYFTDLNYIINVDQLKGRSLELYMMDFDSFSPDCLGSRAVFSSDFYMEGIDKTVHVPIVKEGLNVHIEMDVEYVY